MYNFLMEKTLPSHKLLVLSLTLKRVPIKRDKITKTIT